MTNSERVILAIRENAGQIDANDYMEIQVKIHDGRVALLEMGTKIKARQYYSMDHPEHYEAVGYGGTEYFSECVCGFKATGKTRKELEAQMTAHLTAGN